VTLYWASTAAMPTTVAPATVTPTPTTATTILQVATPSTNTLKVVAFGIEFGAALTAACTVELIDSGTVPATALNAHVAAGVQPYSSDSAGGASSMTLGASATGWWKTGQAEGTITSVRSFKNKILPVGSTSYEWEWSLGREPFIPVSHFLRIRTTTATNAALFAWCLWDE
jgi:hypothetical protein